MSIITAADVQDMVLHWLETPAESILGSGYGADIPSLLLQPLSGPVADAFLAKLRDDVPILQTLASDYVEMRVERLPPDKQIIYIDVAGSLIRLPEDPQGPRAALLP